MRDGTHVTAPKSHCSINNVLEMIRMATSNSAFFSWTARRVRLTGPRLMAVADERENVAGSGRSHVTLDMQLSLGADRCRLVACTDPSGEIEYLALFVGDVSGAGDVPVRVVAEETILLRNSFRDQSAEIVIADPQGSSTQTDQGLFLRLVDHQMCCGGTIRDLVALSGAMSVTVEWMPSQQAA
ncbi:hypothetical protein [Rhodococcus koreensis]|uniref:hypothetical protein n=1 Tax=Rhodococcus koreensis TaxID=99653 RepID=UPI00366E2002